MELLPLFAVIALVVGGLSYRLLPNIVRKYVDLDSSLGELLAFCLGAVLLVAIIGFALVMSR